MSTTIRGMTWILGLLALMAWARATSAQEMSPGGGSDAVSRVPADSVLLVYHSADVYGLLCHSHTIHVLRYTKMPHAAFDLARSSHLPDLEAYSAVLVATDRIRELSISDARRVAEYVAEGGGLAMLVPGWHPLLAKVFGRPAIFEPSYLPPDQEEPFMLHGLLLPGAEGLSLPALDFTSFDFSGVDAALEDDATVLASAGPDGRPLAWLHPYGEGRALFWNASLLGEKSFRGLVAQSLVAVQPRTVRPMANWAVVYLDDFPSPASPEKLDPIATEFDQAVAAFYAERWYPDIRRLADRYGVEYTSALVFSYGGSTAPPYRFEEWLMGRIIDDGRAVYYAPWISRRDAQFSEVGLHGYNHQPLLLKNWKTEEEMIRALKSARRRWKVDDIGPPPKTYVPPMNLIDSVGVRALSKAFPSINTIAGLHQGLFERGQDREFGPEPWNKNLYALPRNTSGYIMTGEMQLAMLSLLHVIGGWGHFIHPDDVFPNEDRYERLRSSGVDIPEEGFRWYGAPENDGLYYRFTEWLEFAKKHYPWVRYMKAQDAVHAMKRYQAMQFVSTSEGDQIIVEASLASSFFTVYSTHKEVLTGLEGGEVVHKGEAGLFTYYVVKSKQREVSFRLKENV